MRLPSILSLCALCVATPALAETNWEDDAFPHDPDRVHVPYGRDLPEDPPVPVTVTRSELRRRLASAELELCLAPLLGPHRGTVRARLGRDGSVTVRTSVTPASADGETCLRRTAEAMLSWSGPVRVEETLRTTVTLRSRGTEPNASPSLAAAIDAVDDALVACVTGEDDVSGTLELTLEARRTGRARLVSARLGAFVPDAAARTCLEGVVAGLRVPPTGEEETVRIGMGS